MIAIQTIRITVKSNGAFKSNAVLVKDRTGKFYLITDHSFAFPDADPATWLLELGQAITTTGHLYYYRVDCGTQPIDSFPTVMLAMSTSTANDGSIFGAYCYEMLEGGFHIVEGDDYPEINLNEQTTTDTSGVTIKNGYTRTYSYRGIGNGGTLNRYHYHQSSTQFNTPLAVDKPWRIGIELELYARNSEAFGKITSANSNWFQCERDGSLDESINGVAGLGIEMKTIPLKACDAKSVDFWTAPMTKLAQLAKTKENPSTGLHVHIGKEILGGTDSERQRTLDKLTFFYYYLVEDIIENHRKNVTICGRERGYSTDPDAGKTELSENYKLVGWDAILKAPAAFEKMATTITEKVRTKRDDINLKHLNTYGTIEFRKAKGIISKTRIAAVVTWWEQMCLYCRNTPASELSFDAFFEKVTRENPAVAYFFARDEEV